MFNPNLDTGIESILNVESTSLVDVLVTLNVEIPPTFSEFKQTNQFATALSSIPNIVDNYLDAQMQNIIKEQVKAQVIKQVSKILPKIEQSINDQLEAELLTRSSNEA
ncbi:hypothetical protein Tco_0124451 [Tanacetum coccineum]